MSNKLNSKGMIPYPTGQTICFFDNVTDIDEFLEALYFEGIDTSNFDLISGASGINRIDIYGNRHHFFGKFIRAAQKFWGSGEWHLFKIADYELRIGHHMIALFEKMESSRTRIVTLMKKHKGHNITYFNRFYVQEF